jgi:hypothetical protein
MLEASTPACLCATIRICKIGRAIGGWTGKNKRVIAVVMLPFVTAAASPL